MPINYEILNETITSLKPTFDYNSVIIYLKNGTSFQPILTGELTDILEYLTSASSDHRIPNGYNIVDTFTGCRIIYKIEEISHIEFKPEIEDGSPLVYEFN